MRGASGSPPDPALGSGHAGVPSAARRAGFGLRASFLLLVSCASPPDEPGSVFLVNGSRFAGSFTLSGETRMSLAPPLGTDVTFPLRLPQNGVLRFGIGALAPGGEILPSRIAFRVHLESETGRETVFEEELRRFQPNQWLDRRVDLGDWAGAKVTLVLETEAAGEPGKVAPLWGNPVLDAGASPLPNLFVISLDCLRADHVGAYGYERDTTPRIDRLAEAALVFETAVATAPETLPSHVSMFTGLPPSLHGASKWSRLPDSVPYLPELLGRNGYEVSALVTGAFLSQSFGVQRGFHRYRYLDAPGAAATVDAALEMLSQLGRSGQFFLLHLFDAHWPYHPPRDLTDRFGPRPRDISGLVDKIAQQDYRPSSPAEIQQVVDLYDAEIVYLDREVGRFLDHLSEAGLFENALVAVVGDHGEAFYEHGWWQHTFTVYEEMIRVPLIVKWPGSTPRGRVQTPAGQVDLFPTLLRAAGLAPPPSDGVDLAEMAGAEIDRMLVSEASWRIEDRFFWKISLRSLDRKYIASFEDASPSRPAGEELYHLEADPEESVNLVPETSREEIAAFRRSLRSYLAEVRDARARRETEEPVVDEALEERLKALGYVR